MEIEPNVRNEAAKAELTKLMQHFGIDKQAMLVMVSQLPEDATVGGKETPSINQKDDQESTGAKLKIQIQNIVEQFRAEQSLTALGELMQQLEAEDLKELGLTIRDWMTWLGEKAKVFQNLSDADAADKVKFWHRALDYYLMNDPAEGIYNTIPAEKVGINREELQPIVQALSERQQQLKAILAEKGISRINAVPGSSFIAGIVEMSDLESVPTDNEQLHNRVCDIQPGEGGYRSHGKVFLTTYARAFRYESPEVQQK